jgi:hypothetical protein
LSLVSQRIPGVRRTRGPNSRPWFWLGAVTNDESLLRHAVHSVPADVRALALAARKWVLALLPGAQETVDCTGPVVGYGYGAGYRGIVCTLILARSDVKLGLNHGARLYDPDRLLQGSGKVHRYVQLKSPRDLHRRGLRRLLKAADAARVERDGRTSGGRHSALPSGGNTREGCVKLPEPEYLAGGWPIRLASLESRSAAQAPCSADLGCP